MNRIIPSQAKQSLSLCPLNQSCQCFEDVVTTEHDIIAVWCEGWILGYWQLPIQAGGRNSSSSVPISRPNEYCDGQDTAQPPQWGGGGEWMRIFREKYCQLMWTMSHKSTAISSCVSVWSEEAPSQLEQVCVWQTCQLCWTMLCNIQWWLACL